MFWNKRKKPVTEPIDMLRAEVHQYGVVRTTQFMAIHKQLAELREAVEQLRAQVTVIGGFVNADLARKLEGALEFQSKLNAGDVVMGETHGF